MRIAEGSQPSRLASQLSSPSVPSFTFALLYSFTLFEKKVRQIHFNPDQ